MCLLKIMLGPYLSFLKHLNPTDNGKGRNGGGRLKPGKGGTERRREWERGLGVLRSERPEAKGKKFKIFIGGVCSISSGVIDGLDAPA